METSTRNWVFDILEICWQNPIQLFKFEHRQPWLQSCTWQNYFDVFQDTFHFATLWLWVRPPCRVWKKWKNIGGWRPVFDESGEGWTGLASLFFLFSPVRVISILKKAEKFTKHRKLPQGRQPYQQHNNNLLSGKDYCKTWQDVILEMNFGKNCTNTKQKFKYTFWISSLSGNQKVMWSPAALAAASGGGVVVEGF